MREEEIRIEVENIELVGWACWPEKEIVEGNGSKTPLLFLCHGIPGGRPDEKKEEDGGYPALAERCCREGFPVFYFNFRGTGESGGNFDLQGWKKDLVAWLNYWAKREGKREFWLWGFSGGAAVSACVTAQEERIGATILAACPASFDEIFREDELPEIISRFREIGIIRADFPPDSEGWLSGILSMSPESYIKRTASRPLLLVHGSEDELVPVSHAYRLYKKTGEDAELILVQGAGHQLRKDEKAVEKCLEWIKKQAQKIHF